MLSAGVDGRSRRAAPRLDTSFLWAAAAGEALTDALGALTADSFGGTPDQLVPCTAGQPVTVPVGDRLNMRSYVRREIPLKGDRDNIRLYCLAP